MKNMSYSSVVVSNAVTGCYYVVVSLFVFLTVGEMSVVAVLFVLLVQNKKVDTHTSTL